MGETKPLFSTHFSTPAFLPYLSLLTRTGPTFTFWPSSCTWNSIFVLLYSDLWTNLLDSRLCCIGLMVFFSLPLGFLDIYTTFSVLALEILFSVDVIFMMCSKILTDHITLFPCFYITGWRRQNISKEAFPPPRNLFPSRRLGLHDSDD